MASRGALGASSGKVMREDAIPCERMTRIFATVAGIGGVFLAWPLCHIHYVRTVLFLIVAFFSLSVLFVTALLIRTSFMVDSRSKQSIVQFAALQ